MHHIERGNVTIKMWPDFTKADVEHIVTNLRPSDRHELAALGETADTMADRCIATVGSTPLSYVVYLEGRPVFCYGVTAQTATYVQLWGFGTDETRKIVPTVTRHVKRIWLSELARAGVLRIEARLPSSCRDSLQWLKSCGMDVECEVYGLSVTGESFFQLSHLFPGARHPKGKSTDVLHRISA